MNSDEKLRQLNRLVNDRELSHRSRIIIHSTIQHIKIGIDAPADVGIWWEEIYEKIQKTGI
jgi:hypothetical protein